MSNFWHDIPPGPQPPEQVTAVIEIPSGSRNKYELDKVTGLLKLDRVLYSAVQYPGDYGFIPGTYAEDDDPLDILVLMNKATFTGAVLRARPLGILEMSDEKGRDQKILAVPVDDPRYDSNRHLESISRHRLREIEHFFRIYKELEGKHTNVEGWHGMDETHALIHTAVTTYKAKYPAGANTPLDRRSS